MEDIWRVKLFKLREEFKESLSFDLVAPDLIQKRIISSEDYEIIRDLTGNSGQVERLMVQLVSSSAATYHRFHQFLLAEYDWLAARIDELEVTSDDWNNFIGEFPADHQTRCGGGGKTPPAPHGFPLPSSLPVVGPNKNSAIHPPSHSPSGDRAVGGGAESGKRHESSLCEPSRPVPSSPSNCSSLHEPCHSRISSPHNHHHNPLSHHGNTIRNTLSPLVLSGSASWSPLSSTSNSPLHSSEFSLNSSRLCETGEGEQEEEEQQGLRRAGKRRVQESEEISEEMIQFVSENALVMRKWQNLAHQVGLTGRVPVIQARIRAEGRDFDEHVAELIREWIERRPGEANVRGLINLLRSQKFNDTAGKLEDGSYKKRKWF